MKPHPRTAERYSLDEGGQPFMQNESGSNLQNSHSKVARICLPQLYFESDKAKGSNTDSETICDSEPISIQKLMQFRI